MGAVNRALLANYKNGYTDGFDDGFHRGRIDGHEQGWTDGQQSVIEIMDANGFTVYKGEFRPAQLHAGAVQRQGRHAARRGRTRSRRRPGRAVLAR